MATYEQGIPTEYVGRPKGWPTRRQMRRAELAGTCSIEPTSKNNGLVLRMEVRLFDDHSKPVTIGHRPGGGSGNPPGAASQFLYATVNEAVSELLDQHWDRIKAKATPESED